MEEEKKNSSPELGNLTEEQYNTAIAWLNKKWPDHKRICDICEENNWEISMDEVTPLLFNPNEFPAKGNAYPQFLLTCLNCGNTRYFNSVIAGVTKREDDGN